MKAAHPVIDPDLIETLDQLADVATALWTARRQYADGIRRQDGTLRDVSAHLLREQKEIIAVRAQNRGYTPDALIAVLEMAAQLRRSSKRKPQWQEVERALVREAELLGERARGARETAVIARYEAAEAAKAADIATAALELFARVG